MIQLYRTYITKSEYGSNFNSEILFSKWSASLANCKEKNRAFIKLIKYLEKKDKDLYKFIEIGVHLIKFSKNSKFNTLSKQLYANYSFGKRGKEFRLRAIIRLAKYLEKKDPANFYTGTYIFRRVGNTYYNLCEELVEYRTINDKHKIISRKQAAAKAALTKLINKLKGIRESYSKTLFEEDYKKDTKYIHYFHKIYKKREKIRVSKSITIFDIPTFSTEISEEDNLKILNLLYKEGYTGK